MLREKTKEYLISEGKKQNWICQKLGISQGHFSLYLRGDRELSDEREEILRRIVEGDND